MKTFVLPLTVLAVLTLTFQVYAQRAPADRLPSDRFDVVPPTERVQGTPGEMTIRRVSCRVLPTEQTRRRIVDVAVQEWGFFGFPVVDETIVEDGFRRPEGAPPRNRRRRRLDPIESARVAASIAGYWAVTPEGSWIVDRQNAAWRGQNGVAARWRYPWSASFVSWVMCEGGLGDSNQFQRAVAHHTYIDQAIRARDRGTAQAAFAAYDVGEAPIEPGDLLCSGRRPAYRTIAERRRQMGVGARSHCDIVVKLDESNQRILAIGGNVGGAVSLKLLPAVHDPGENLRPVDRITTRGRRTTFAHLKLQADSIEPDALDHTPTIQALPCPFVLRPPVELSAGNVVDMGAIAARC